MTETETRGSALDRARERWGTAATTVGDPRPPRPRWTGVRFTVGAPRIPRVTEQRRDVSAYRLERP